MSGGEEAGARQRTACPLTLPRATHHTPPCSVVRVVSREARIPEDECFALMALAEIPDQYQEVVKKGILKKSAEGK